jgi:PadR family transcriptional regulator, regulatory protein PadR
MAELPKGHLDGFVLAALEAEPGHGYAIVRRLRRQSDDVFRPSEGTVYPSLHRLERDRLVTSRWTEAKGRRRRVYRITAAGREALAVRRLEWASLARAVEAVLAGTNRAALG